ncbi:MAG: hypothetical protein JXA90_10205 [Planctomycetes bacterium]|nr:hypothetical protein [Planctomycetota bacterium]
MRLAEHIAFFLLISFITALVCAANRLPTLRQILRDALHFFFTITVFVFAFCVVVYVLEWIFIRPLL